MRKVIVRTLVAVAAAGLLQLAPVPMAWSAPRTRVALVPGVAGGARPTPFPASHVALRWTGDAHATVELRWRGADGAWRPWEAVEVDGDVEERSRQRQYSALVLTERAAAVAARATAGEADDLEAVVIDAQDGPRRLVRARPTRAGAAVREPAVPPPDVVTRAQWGADESIRHPNAPSFAPLRKLVVHHTDTSNADPDPAATVRAIYAFHVQVRSFHDIGYHFLIDRAGRVYEGRYARAYAPDETPTGEDLEGRAVVGAHAEGVNTGSMGVALLGSFGESPPSTAALDALEGLLAWKADRHELDALASAPYRRTDGSAITFPNISGHRDTRATECPGDRLYAALPAVRREVARTVAAAHGRTRGYWVATADGRVAAFGEAPPLGDLEGQRPPAPVVATATRPDDRGYWLFRADGEVHAFGAARSYGSMGGRRLNRPIVGAAATPTGEGYWLVASDGGVFAFGDARFAGSAGAIRLNKPVVGMATTPSGGGYWLVASDGGVFAYGNARFRGSTGAMRLNSPVVGMHPTPSGGGYWLVAGDGGVFAFGAPFHGSVPGLRLPSYAGSAALRGTRGGAGYYVLGKDGGIFTFGDARFHGARNLAPAPAVDLALLDAPAVET